MSAGGPTQSRGARLENELSALRKHLAVGKTSSEIMRELNVSFSQYVNYMKKLAKQDRKIIDNDENLRDEMYVSLSVLKDRLTGIVRRTTIIAENDSNPPGVRLEAEKILAEASLAILKITFEGSTILKELSPTMDGLATGRMSLENLPTIKTAEEFAPKELPPLEPEPETTTETPASEPTTTEEDKS